MYIWLYSFLLYVSRLPLYDSTRYRFFLIEWFAIRLKYEDSLVTTINIRAYAHVPPVTDYNSIIKIALLIKSDY